MTTFTSWDSELYHHGIKGQKWGVRRYQNTDGSLTSAGEKRYYNSAGQLSRYGKRAFKKEYRKLNRLRENADLDIQRQKLARNEKIAKISGKIGKISGVAAVAGLAGSGGLKIANNILKAKTKAQVDALYDASGKAIDKGWDAWDAYVKANPGGRGMDDHTYNKLMSYVAESEKYSNSAKAVKNKFNAEAGVREQISGKLKTAGLIAGGISVASFGVSAYNKIMAKKRNERLTDIGHSKAVSEAKAQYEKMKKTFGNVKISDIVKPSKIKR